MLCDKLALQRISAKSYTQHLKQAAITRWQITLLPEALTKILELTACHPYYVNVLCGKLWAKDEAPNAEQVENIWNNYATEEISRVAQTIDKLSENQRKLLITLAKLTGVREPSAQSFLSSVNLSGASVRQALKALIANDLVYLNDDDNYSVLDPLFKTVLSR